MDELKNLIMSAYAYQRVVNNWKNPSNNKKKTIDYINNALAEMEKELKEIDENFSIKSQYDKNQSKVNDEQNTIKNKGNRGFKEDAFKEIEAKFKALVEKIKQDKKGEIKPDIGKNEEDEFKHIEPDNKKGDVKNMDEIGEDAHDIDNEEEIGLESKEELLEQLESFKAEEKEIQEQIKIAKVEVEKTEDDYAKEYYAEEVDYEKLVAADKRDKDASAKVEKLENDLNIIRKNMKLVNLKISKLDLEKEKENYLNQEPRDKSSYIWKEWNEDIKKIQAEIESRKKEIKKMENELNEKDTTKEQDEIPEDEQDAYNAVSGKKVYTKEQLESMLERLEKQKQRLENTLAYMLNTEPSDKESKEHTKWKNDIEMLKGRISKVNKNIQEIKNMLKEYEQDSDIDKKGNTDSPNKKQKPPVKPLNGKNDPNRLPDGEIPRRLPEEVEKQKKSPVKKDPSLPEGEIPRRLPAEVERQKKSPVKKDPSLPEGEIPRRLPAEVERQPDPTKALQPLYWQVYNKVATEKCSSFERFMYKMSKAPVMPWNQDMSTVEKTLSVLGTPLRAPMKLFGKIVSKIKGTDKKFKKMKEAVDNLTPEEFSVLVDTSEESSAKFGREVKSHFDEFSLTSDTMRQYKHNTLALDAIGTRIKTETAMTTSIIDKNIVDLKSTITQIQESMQTANVTQKAALANVLMQCNAQLAVLNTQKKRSVEKSDSFFNGLEHRTAKYKDTEGWILGKFNPDNRTANKTMQELQEKYMEAIRNQDTDAVMRTRQEIENFGRSQTKIISVGDNVHNKINRGIYSVDGVKVQNLTPQTIGKQILANLAIIGCLEKVLKDLSNIHVKDQAVQQTNQNIADGNRANQNIPYSQKGTTQVDLHNYLEIDKAEKGMRNINIVAGHEVGEHGNLDMSANATNGYWSGGLNSSAYAARDNALHSVSAAQVTNGTLDSSFQFLRDNINTYKPGMQQYAQSHPFDYSFVQAMDVQGVDAVQKLFHDLNTPINVSFDINGAVTGMQIAPMADIAYDTMTPALMATMLATQSGHLVAKAKENREAEKQKREEERQAKQEAKRAAKEEKNKQKKGIFARFRHTEHSKEEQGEIEEEIEI